MDLVLINTTMFDSVWWSTRTDVHISTMFAFLLGEAFATFLMVLITSFLCFHIWLMSKAMTTVEFCEKSLKKKNYNSSVYSQGFYGNICAVLGPQPLLWLLPLSLPSGDGYSWGKQKGADETGGSGAAPAAPSTDVLSGNNSKRRVLYSRTSNTGSMSAPLADAPSAAAGEDDTEASDR